jgi:hypothetical protein
MTSFQITRPLPPARLWLAMLLCAFSALAFAPSAQAAAGDCNYAPSHDLICILQISNDANATINTYGTNLSQVKALVVTFTDSTSVTYYKPGVGTNPAGSTVEWGVSDTITQAMIDNAALPKGFRDHILAGMLPAAGSRISVTDAANGGKTVLSYKFYDELPISTQRNAVATIAPSCTLDASGNCTGGWVPPAVSSLQTDVDTLTINSPGGLNTVTRVNMTCSDLGLSGSTACPGTLPSFNRPPAGTTLPSATSPGVLVWNDNKIVVKHSGFPGALMSSFTMRNATLIKAYPVSPAIIFAPQLGTAANNFTDKLVRSTTVPNQYTIKGASFGRLNKLRVRLEDGTIRTIVKTGASDAGVSFVQWLEPSITVTDSAIAGHSIESVWFYYAGSPDPVAEITAHEYFLGTISSATSTGDNSLTILGTGLQAIVSLLLTFDDLTTLTLNFAENTGTYDQLTITDEALGGKTITEIKAYAYDGQVMTRTITPVHVQQAAPVNTALPVISGNPAVGSQLTVSNGTWTIQGTATYSYQWKRCITPSQDCQDISGATASTYTVTGDDSSHFVTAVVTASNGRSTPAWAMHVYVEGGPIYGNGGGRMTYEGYDGTGTYIGITSADGTGNERLTPPGSQTSFDSFLPTLSPDGTKVAYMRYDRTLAGNYSPTTGFYYELMVMDLSTRVSVPVSHQYVRDITGMYSWSPDSTRLVFSDGGSIGNTPYYITRLWIVNADGTNGHPMANAPQGGMAMPSWSPDGTKIMYVGNLGGGGSTSVINADETGEPLTPYTSPHYTEGDPIYTAIWSARYGVWSADSQYIYAVGYGQQYDTSDWSVIGNGSTGKGMIRMSVASTQLCYDTSDPNAGWVEDPNGDTCFTQPVDETKLLHFANYEYGNTGGVYWNQEMLEIVNVNTAGTKLNFGVRRQEYDSNTGSEKYITELWTLNTDGSGSPIRLQTDRDARYSVTSYRARYSPDDSLIAYNCSDRQNPDYLSANGLCIISATDPDSEVQRILDGEAWRLGSWGGINNPIY